MPEATGGLGAVLARITASGTHDDGQMLAQLVDELRPDDADDTAQAVKNLQALQYLLGTREVDCRALAAYLTALLGTRAQIDLYTDFGILPGTGFYTEAARRLMHRILPPVLDPRALSGLVKRVFPRSDDHVWVSGIGTAHWAAVFDQLRFAFAGSPHGRATLAQIVESVRIIAHRIAALGLEPDLVAVRPELRRHLSPFIAQCSETQGFLASLTDDGVDRKPGLEDARHILVLLDQCDDVIARVRRGTSETGIGIALTYILQRLTDNIARQRTLLSLLDEAPANPRTAPAAQLLAEFVDAANNGNRLRQHLARNTELLAREVTEHSGRTGEHYITSTRDEFRGMFRAALGAGLIVPFMALAKLALGGLHAAPFIQGLLYSLMYAAGFILIHVLHFALATKQPAMTATRIAQALESSTDRRLDLAPLVELIVRVTRTQFIAIVGNVVLALPLAWFLGRAMFLATGTHPAGIEKAGHLLHDLHPWASLALFHAAIAGVYLFMTGLVSGYFDNLSVYRNIPARLRHLGWLRAVLGEDRAARFANYVEHNLGGLVGNAFFGFALGMTAVVGYNFGLPLDIRHVTFSAANFGLAIETLDTGVGWIAIGIACLGIALVGVVNLAVSFSLALLVAMRARRVRFAHARPLMLALGKRFLSAPLDFMRPPREMENDIGRDPAPPREEDRK
jgi:site-specific recombinase